MTTAGIITMLLSIGFVWTLLILCSRRLLKAAPPAPKRSSKKNK